MCDGNPRPRLYDLAGGLDRRGLFLIEKARCSDRQQERTRMDVPLLDLKGQYACIKEPVLAAHVYTSCT